MSISGDMVAGLASRFGLTHDVARAMVTRMLETANDPNFAYRYAAEEADEGLSQDELMLRYWSVIRLLQASI